MIDYNYRQPDYSGPMTWPPVPANQPVPVHGTGSASGCHQPAARPEPVPEKDNMYAHVDQMVVGMSYTPMQKFCETFESCQALQAGTIFPDLYKPWCGKGGAR